MASLTLLSCRVAAAVAVLCLAGCCSPCKKRSSSSAGAGASASPPAASSKAIPIAPGDDIPPARWSTPAESDAALPSWASGFGYAPQLEATIAREWFNRAGAAGATPDEAMALCRVAYDETPDQGLKGLFNASAPDLTVRVRLDSKTSLSASGPEDTHEIMVSAPLLSAGVTRLELDLVDRDGIGSDSLATLNVAIPSSAETTRDMAHAECRLIPRATVESGFDRAAYLTDNEIGKVADRLEADLELEDLGRRSILSKVMTAMAPMAALVGWADPRVKRRVEWTDRIVTRHQQLCAELAKREASAHPRTATFSLNWAEWTAEVIGWECGPEVSKRYVPAPRAARKKTPGCVVALRVQHQRETPVSLDVFGEGAATPTVELVHADGQVVPLWYVTEAGVKASEQPNLEAGKPGIVRFATEATQSPWELEPGRRGALLILRPPMAKPPALFGVDGLGRWDGKTPAP